MYRIAAFFGALMNSNYMLAGSASTSPVLFVVSIGLMLAWKVAGLVGLDPSRLPRLGPPWLGRRMEPVPVPVEPGTAVPLIRERGSSGRPRAA